MSVDTMVSRLAAFEKAVAQDRAKPRRQLLLAPGTALTADGSQILLMEFEPNSTTNYTGNNGFSCECTPSLPPPPGRSLPDAARW